MDKIFATHSSTYLCIIQFHVYGLVKERWDRVIQGKDLKILRKETREKEGANEKNKMERIEERNPSYPPLPTERLIKSPPTPSTIAFQLLL